MRALTFPLIAALTAGPALAHAAVCDPVDPTTAEVNAREGVRLAQTIAVGDGANDLPMLDAAGLGIAFHAKPRVRAEAEQVISNLGLDGILYLLGMSDREVQQA